MIVLTEPVHWKKSRQPCFSTLGSLTARTAYFQSHRAAFNGTHLHGACVRHLSLADWAAKAAFFGILLQGALKVPYNTSKSGPITISASLVPLFLTEGAQC